MQKLKQALLGTAAGRAMMSARNTIDILSTAIRSPESVGTIANDQIAQKLVTSLCLPGKTFIDVGSHIGSVIADVIYHDKSINIVAIEAIPVKANALRRKFPMATVYQGAIGDHEGDVSFFINPKLSGYSSLGKAKKAKGLVEITVPMMTLDGLIDENNVDVIKIDVEGAELAVMRGAKNMIEHNRPVIMFESGPDINGLGYTKEAMWEFFYHSNYTIHAPSWVAHNDAGLSLECFIDSHVYPRRTTNYFAIPVERRDEVRDRARKVLGINPN